MADSSGKEDDGHVAKDNGRMIDGPKNGSSVGVLLPGPSESDNQPLSPSNLISSRAVSHSNRVEEVHSIARLHGNL